MTLQELRLSRGLSRKELADKLGVAVPTVCRYENGNRRLPVPVAMKIGALLNVSWPELYEQSDTEKT